MLLKPRELFVNINTLIFSPWQLFTQYDLWRLKQIELGVPVYSQAWNLYSVRNVWGDLRESVRKTGNRFLPVF